MGSMEIREGSGLHRQCRIESFLEAGCTPLQPARGRGMHWSLARQEQAPRWGPAKQQEEGGFLHRVVSVCSQGCRAALAELKLSELPPILVTRISDTRNRGEHRHNVFPQK